MKKLFVFAVTLLALAGMAPAADLCTPTLDMVTSIQGQSCTLGPFTFQDFHVTWTGSSIGVVYLSSDTKYAAGVATLGFTPVPYTAYSDIAITYTVLGPLAGIGGSADGGAGFSWYERAYACTDASCTSKTLVGETGTGKGVAYFPVSSFTWIAKDYQAAGGVGVGTVSTFTQNHYTPEPMTLVLLGSGLLGVGLLRRVRA